MFRMILVSMFVFLLTLPALAQEGASPRRREYTSRQKERAINLFTLRKVVEQIDAEANVLRRQRDMIRENGKMAAGNRQLLGRLSKRFRDRIAQVESRIQTPEQRKAATRQLILVQRGMKAVRDSLFQINQGRFTRPMVTVIDRQIRDVLEEADGVITQLTSLSSRLDAVEESVREIETRQDRMAVQQQTNTAQIKAHDDTLAAQDKRLANVENRVVRAGAFFRVSAWGFGTDSFTSGATIGPELHVPLPGRWSMDVSAGAGYGGVYGDHSLMMIDVAIDFKHTWTFDMVTGLGGYYGATIGFFEIDGDMSPTTDQYLAGRLFVGYAWCESQWVALALTYGDRGHVDTGHEGAVGVSLEGVFTF